MRFTYFAYGSNMLSKHLIARCESAEFINVAYAPGFTLEFTKKSVDGSGKATLVETNPATRTPGVLFKIDESERAVLDKVEGAGYDRHDDFQVEVADGTKIATTYLASKRQENLIPYDWYLKLIITGAQEHNLCQSHVDCLLTLKTVSDQKKDRKSRTDAIQALDDHG